MVCPTYPEGMLRCTRLTLSRRDQQLGSWGRLYASPLCTNISGQVTLVSTEPYQQVVDPLWLIRGKTYKQRRLQNIKRLGLH